MLLTLGAILLIGLATDALGRLTPLPRVTLLLVFGFLIGNGGLDVLPEPVYQWFDVVAVMALVMVGFLLGGQFSAAQFRRTGRQVVTISVVVVVVTAMVVLLALWLTEVPLVVALILAGVAPATAPAATVDVVHEANAKGPFSQTLLGIVALDDAWGLMLFSLLLAVAATVTDGISPAMALSSGAWEILGAVVLGLVLGLPVAQLSGRLQPGEPLMTEALGAVFVCGGLAIWLNVSFIIAAMVMGTVVVNLARHHERPFHEIENVEWPFMILFFVLAGASLQLEALTDLGLVGTVYVAARVAGRVVGGWMGGQLSHATPSIRRWMGLALMPQAGVALGMALIAVGRFPDYRTTILPLVIASTVFFELTGPMLTRLALQRSDEVRLPD
ncbi:MAG: cation:proton antiporter [Planctomycetales bacterium]|nr:cation:proton antiporter [Planctomycetales bacterium]